MLLNFINIEGVENPNNFPIIGLLNRYKQFEINESVFIPEVKPDVEQITEVMVEATVTDYKTIITPVGLKVIIDGKLNQKIMYVANEATQSVHTAEFTKNFCDVVEIELIIPANGSVQQVLATAGVTLDTAITGKPKILIEDMSVMLVNTRTVSKCTILFTWVDINPLLTAVLLP